MNLKSMVDLVRPKKAITREEVKGDEKTQEIRRRIQSCQELVRPPMQNAMGYAVIFIYRNNLNGTGTIRCDSDLGAVNEQIANDAVKELARHMMIKYGRKPRTDMA